MNSLRERWSHLLSFTRQFAAAAPRQFAIAGILAVVLGLTEGITTLLLIPLLDATGVNVSQGSLGRLSEYVQRAFAVVHLRPTLGTALAIYVAVTTVRSLLTQWRAIASVRAGSAFVVALRTRLYARIAGANWLFLARSRSTDFAHMMTDELLRVYAMTYELLNVLTGAFVTLVFIALALRISASMTAVVVAAGGILVALLGPEILRAQRDGGQVSEATKRLYGAISEHLASLKTAKSYGAEQRHIESLAEFSKEVAATELKGNKTYAMGYLVFDVGSVAALAVMVYVGLNQFALGSGAVLMLVYLVARVMPRIATFQRGLGFIAHRLPSFEAYVALEKRLEEEQEHPAPSNERIPLNHSIRLQHVSFSYTSPDRPAIHDLTLEIRRGSLVAIVGPSGSGKSTVADIITALQRPQQGSVVIDGRILDDSRIVSWRREIGYVSQDTFVFHDTVRANLLWANPSAGEDDIVAALKMAQAEFVFTLEHGLETVLGDRGVRLSGGERQRLALARALIRKPQLLVLDEPSSALDVENERHILDAIQRLRGKVTTLLITHRLAAVRRADEVYVLENGRLVESGSWEALSQSTESRFHALAEVAELN
jgi:ATP-binding cassette, subfamily C, bacterial